MKALIDTLHILICKTPHVYDMMKFLDRKEGLCYYYLEHDVANCESLPDHQKWAGVCEQFKKHLDLTSDEEALQFVRQALNISNDLRKLVGDNRDRMEFVRELMR